MTATVQESRTAEAVGWMAQIHVDGDGTRWGDSAAEFQMTNATAILDATDVDAVRQFFVPGTRGARKTTDVAALCLTLLENQAPAYAKGFFIASDEDQAKDILEVAAEMIARTPGLRDLFTTTGDRLTHIRSGASFTALANDPSAMGKRPWFIIADELSNWPESKASRKFWTAMTTATEKVPGCRLVVLTNAGSPAHWSFKRFEVAQKSRHWQVLHVPAPLPWHDAAALERNRENCLTEAEFQRLFLNVWTDEDSRLTTVEQVRACITERRRPIAPQPHVRYVAGLDAGVVNDATVLTLAHLEPRAQRFPGVDEWSDVVPSTDERRATVDQLAQDALWTVVIDGQWVWQGTRARPVDLSEVESAAVRILRLYRATLVLDPWQTLGIQQRVRSAGLAAELYPFNQRSKAVLATTMIRLFRAQAIDLPDDEQLLDELVHVNVRENSQGVVSLDHDPGRHDDRAISIALAAQHLLAGTKAEARRLAQRRFFTKMRDRGDIRGGARVDDQMRAVAQEMAAAGDPYAQRALQARTPTNGGRSWR